MKTSTESRASRFKRSVVEGPVLLPGTFYPFGALQIQAQGFEACYVSGAAVSNSLGFVDEGYVSREDMVRIVRDIHRVSDLPLLVDCDTGLLPRWKLKTLWARRRLSTPEAFVEFCMKGSSVYGDKYAVSETVKALEKEGVAAVQLEDQDWCWKRCGHVEGKRLVSADKMVERLQEARRARKNRDLMIIARTDARQPEGFEAVVRRALVYKDAGVDAIFPEALETLEEFTEFRRLVPDIPLVGNLAEQGKTDSSITAQDLIDVGYNIILFPATATRAMFLAFEAVLTEIQEQGTVRQLADDECLIPRSEVDEFLRTHSRMYWGT